MWHIDPKLLDLDKKTLLQRIPPHHTIEHPICAAFGKEGKYLMAGTLYKL
jgi:hypothetical protein